ncbi:UDP-N-acetylmuramate dehydrogenase [Snodgrassella alvi]|uniref:UDP-N-acetylmuramate dehydrogenase n=1 Tax=Snodgrassella alvi TaxID=1196083 RepID=UPI0035183610
MMDVTEYADLQPLHTFALPVRARWLVSLTDVEQLPKIMALPQFEPERVLWLGGGSNILFCADYPGLVVRVANRGIELVADDGDRVVVEAAAGENWHDFVQYTLAQGWCGLENLSLIPGTVGAAPVQNIGAYGVEVQSCIDAVQVYDFKTNELCWLDCDECGFAYRDSIFKHAEGRYLIVAVRFVLSHVFKPQLRYGDLAQVASELAEGQALTASKVAQAVCHIRKQKLPDPQVLGSAGSFFKNPVVPATLASGLLKQYPSLPHYPQPDGQVKLAAGWLIDQCGLKGFQLGGAAVHERQALVLVNKDHASAADVVALSEYVQNCVAQRFQVRLEPEPIWQPQ